MCISLGYQCLLSSMKTIFWLNVLLDSLSKNSEIHSYATRQAEKIYVPKYKKTAAQKIVRYRCVKVWNYVSTIMSIQCSIISFKSNLKFFFLKYGAFDKMHQCVF